MKHRLIVGYDGSAASTEALEWAAREAESRGAAVHVLSSYAPPPVLDFGYATAGAIWDDDQIPAWMAHQLSEAVTATFENHAGVEHTCAAVGVRPGTALIEAAREADLLAVGSSGTGAVSHLLLGSVTAELLASSPCPVVVCPTETHDTTGRVVVGTDGSDPAGRAVEWAVEEANRRRCELVVAHAWTPTARLIGEGTGRGGRMHEVGAELVLEHAVRRVRDMGDASAKPALVQGGASQVLLDLSETADLVVVGSRGRGGFRSMLFGSVAHAVAAHASCPAVIVH
ncbi:universal stress protein [Ilumatobacter nonamiensis]|uniref:universal stress protein n=1 Tax=Ilumatobacter nonamiensis TaxID=467093 RepID=UPI000347810A|nr:universal stress protein [Ilumatobacter nonamiensis]